MALPRKNRITSKKEIDYVFKNGRKIRGYFLFLRFVGNQIGYPRFVFIIPSKFISLAVDRNRIRRLFSEEIKKMRDDCYLDFMLPPTAFNFNDDKN